MEKIYGDSTLVTLPKELVIPEIDDTRLKELYQLLKPIVTVDEIKYLLREFALDELRNQSYIWNGKEDKRKVVNPSNLETIDDFLCLHRWGYYGLFKPSIAEVLAQTPDRVVEAANAFEIIESPETIDDLYKYPEVLNNGFHLSKVRAYRIHK